jgi:hypothetical protein
MRVRKKSGIELGVTYVARLVVAHHGDISSLAENRETLLPALVGIWQRLHVTFGANERIHGTPTRLEGIMESDILGIHLRFVPSEGFGLLVVGPLCMEKKRFSSKGSQIGLTICGA